MRDVRQAIALFEDLWRTQTARIRREREQDDRDVVRKERRAKRQAARLRESAPSPEQASSDRQLANAPERRIVRELKPPSTRNLRSAFAFPLVGNPEPVELLNGKEVRAIHFLLVDEFAGSRDPIDPPGVKNDLLLESAVYRPSTSLGGIPKSRSTRRSPWPQRHCCTRSSTITPSITVTSELRWSLLSYSSIAIAMC
jgi:hypothetical protein